jgi:hypothetical protein
MDVCTVDDTLTPRPIIDEQALQQQAQRVFWSLWSACEPV